MKVKLRKIKKQYHKGNSIATKDDTKYALVTLPSGKIMSSTDDKDLGKEYTQEEFYIISSYYDKKNYDAELEEERFLAKKETGFVNFFEVSSE
jgi:hypothetical protein